MTRKAVDKPIPMEVLEATARILRVLGHPHRLKIIELIANRELPVGQVAERVGIAPNVCSQHLNIMKAHGVVSSRRNGKVIHYKVDNVHALNVLACIRRHAD